MSILAMAAVAAAAYTDIPVIVGKRTVGETCVISARDQTGPFEAVVSWAPCREVSIRLTSIAELGETNEFNGLECQDVVAIVRSNGGHLIGAWGENSATIYARDRETLREITIAD